MEGLTEISSSAGDADEQDESSSSDKDTSTSTLTGKKVDVEEVKREALDMDLSIFRRRSSTRRKIYGREFPLGLN